MDKATSQELAQIIWDYHKLNNAPQKADVIIAMGSHDTRTAERAAELFLQGFAPILVCSGGAGKLTEEWTEPEAEVYAKIAIKAGVPEDKILKEDKSTNTGDNVVFSKKLLEEKGYKISKVLLVHKPYMERRAYATCRKLWPEVECFVTSMNLTMKDYADDKRGEDIMMHVMVGDLQRLKIYVKKGFLIHQDIPEKVEQAYEELVKRGYTNYVVKE